MAAGGRLCPRPPTAKPAPTPRRPPGPRLAPEHDSEPRPSALRPAGRARTDRPPPTSFRGLGPGTNRLPDGRGAGRGAGEGDADWPWWAWPRPSRVGEDLRMHVPLRRPFGEVT